MAAVSIASCKAKPNSSLLELVLADGRSFLIYRELAAKYALSELAELEEDMLRRLLLQNDLRRAYQRALYLLDGQAYSYQMLFRKLRQHYPEEVCFPVLNRLARQGILNDRRFAEQVARRYAEQKHYGPRRLRQILWQKGIPPQVLADVVAPYEDPEQQTAHIVQLLQRKYGYLLEDPEDLRSVEKCKAALARCGYGYSAVLQGIRAWQEE